MVGKNPIVLVGTKLDLLPEGAHPKDVAEWLMESATRKRLNVVSCHLVSSHSGEGVSSATSKICRERKGRDVYVIGAANVRGVGVEEGKPSRGCIGIWRRASIPDRSVLPDHCR